MLLFIFLILIYNLKSFKFKFNLNNIETLSSFSIQIALFLNENISER